MKIVNCPYCGKGAKRVYGLTIYPHRPDLAEKQFWQCAPCDAYVGCHKNTDWNPLGRLANRELRAAKLRAHGAFDPIWQQGSMKRGSAYAWLSETLGIPKNECHIGMMNVADCNRVYDASIMKRFGGKLK